MNRWAPEFFEMVCRITQEAVVDDLRSVDGFAVRKSSSGFYVTIYASRGEKRYAADYYISMMELYSMPDPEGTLRKHLAKYVRQVQVKCGC